MSERRPGVNEKYVNVIPLTDGSLRTFQSLVATGSKMYAAALYLCAGRYMPDVAKKHGLYHGLCDKDGMRVDEGTATHIGFTGGFGDEMESVEVKP